MIFAAVAPVFLIVIIGLIVRRVGLLQPEADRTLIKLSVNLLYPCLIADSIIGNEALTKGGNLWLPPLVAFFFIGLGYLLFWIGACLLKFPPGAARRTFTYVGGIQNFGYTAIPLVTILFGTETLGILFVHNLGVELAFWLGAAFILPQGGVAEKPLWRRIVTPPVLAVIVSLLLNGMGIQKILPAWLFEGVEMLGETAIPLALLMTGGTLGDFLAKLTPNRQLLKTALGATVIRVGLLPLFFIAAAKWFPCPIELKQVLVIQAAMPCAMFPVVLVKHHHGDTAMAVTIVVVTTALAILSIPWWVGVGMRFVGL